MISKFVRKPICGGALLGEANREAPAQAELRPTSAGASRVAPPGNLITTKAFFSYESMCRCAKSNC
jgi:hypothetical protein